MYLFVATLVVASHIFSMESLSMDIDRAEVSRLAAKVYFCTKNLCRYLPNLSTLSTRIKAAKIHRQNCKASMHLGRYGMT